MPSPPPPPRAFPAKTLLATGALALALSLAPLPEAWRPFPRLEEAPRDTLAALAWPRARRARPPVVVAEVPEAPPRTVEVHEAHEGTAPARPRLRDAESRKWDSLLGRLEAIRPPVVNPCLDQDCSTTALTPWFEALSESDAAPARAVVIGTSLIASDHITDVLRRRLQRRAGDGGPGFLFVDRPTRNAGRAVRAGVASEGWRIEKITDETPLAPAGLTGAAFFADAEPQETTFATHGATHLTLFGVAGHRRGSVRVYADAEKASELVLEGAEGTPLFPSLELKPGIERVRLVTHGEVRLDGAVLEANAGVVLDSLGLPGASAAVLLNEDEALVAAQLAARAPSLVVLMIGGNDAFDLSLGRYTLERVRERMGELVTRVRRAAPAAACLLVTPPDAGVWRLDETIAPREQTAPVAAVMREVATEQGCASYDLQAAMGGEGAIERWWTAGLMNHDLVHPLALGGDLLGYQLEEALDDARRLDESRGREPLGPREPEASVRRHPRPRVEASPRAPAEPPGLHDGSPSHLSGAEHLARLFGKLRALEAHHEGRVGIVQLGASHTAAHVFTDEGRRLLAERFGGAGRGFIAAGAASPRLERGGVSRSLNGSWQLADALQQRVSGQVWGLTGVRAIGAPGASFTVDFSEPRGDPDDVARLQVFTEPNGVVPEVLIDGQAVELTIDPAARDVEILEFVAPGPRHVVTVRNSGPAPSALFGVSQELLRPGVVWDALGLPGSTAATLASYEQGALVRQLAARRPDLYVLFFGTNESALPPPRIAEMRAAYQRIFASLRAAAPDADCLVLAPTDRLKWTPRGWQQADSATLVATTMQELADTYGCAFWATREAMGGPGSIERWRRLGLGHRDRVHLTTEGYQRLAGLAVRDLLEAYDAREVRP